MKLLISILLLTLASAFVVRSTEKSARNPFSPSFAEDEKKGGIFEGINNFWQELDAFMDDASARRLGNGAAFYGKRKSNFYGEKDKNKKKDRSAFDPSEDYRGPSQAGYFQWMPDEDGNLKPVTRMKNRIIEKKVDDA